MSSTAVPPTCPSCGTPPSKAQETAEASEPVTHCEWCGAEYPVPEDRPSA